MGKIMSVAGIGLEIEERGQGRPLLFLHAGGIDRPTLLLWGAEDRIVTPAYGEGWRQAIPGALLEIIAAAGHFPHWQQPEAFVERVSTFVEQNGRSPASK